MAKSIRLIFAYPALVVSNDVALFTVQMVAILLKRKTKFFSEVFQIQPLKSMTEVAPAMSCPNVPLHDPAECIRRPEEVSEFFEPDKQMVKKAISRRKAEFIDTMDCLPVTKLPEGPEWTYELKLDGYRLEAVRAAGETTLYSRRRNVLNQKFPYIVSALNSLPEDTVIDGELVAMGPDGRPNFNLLQNFRSAEAHITYYAFDVLVHKGKDLTLLPLSERRRILHSVIKPSEHLALSEVSDQTASQMLGFVRSHGLEGIVAKRSDGVYQPGMRTGVWSKHRINLGQEFVVGGYTPGTHGLDALIVGFYVDKELRYAARVRAGFIPATRREVFAKIKDFATTKCPFANLPEKQAGRWGQGLTADKMKDCIWLRPEAVARIDFLEWTGADHLRHTKFVALRDDKDPRKVVRET
jgi:DNA ligase D-like protein (predicted ligase)